MIDDSVHMGTVYMKASDRNPELDWVGEALEVWSSQKRANVSLDSFDCEVGLWKRLTGRQGVKGVLEVGCGSGLFLMYLLARGFAETATGIDPAFEQHGTAEEEMERTRALASASGLSQRVAFRRISLEGFMREDRRRTFDLIVFRLCLHHIYERSRSIEGDEEVVARCVTDLAELRTLLSDGGHLYVREASAPSWIHGKAFNLYHRVKGARPIDWRGKRSPAEWTALLQKAGYREVVSAPLPPNRLTKTHWMRRVGARFSPAFLMSAAK